jgi:hypothetical protein
MARIAGKIRYYAFSQLIADLRQPLLRQFAQIGRKTDGLQKRTIGVSGNYAVVGRFAHLFFFLSISGATYLRHSGTKIIIPEAATRKSVRSVKPPPAMTMRHSHSHTSKSTDNPTILIGFIAIMIHTKYKISNFSPKPQMLTRKRDVARYAIIRV